jgi:hypothetical protein
MHEWVEKGRKGRSTDKKIFEYFDKSLLVLINLKISTLKGMDGAEKSLPNRKKVWKERELDYLFDGVWRKRYSALYWSLGRLDGKGLINCWKSEHLVGGLAESGNECTPDRTLVLKPSSLIQRLAQSPYWSHIPWDVYAICTFLNRKGKWKISLLSQLYGLSELSCTREKFSLSYKNVAYTLEETKTIGLAPCSLFTSLWSHSWYHLYAGSYII